MSLSSVARRTHSRLLTAADLAALPDELPSGPVQYELDNGKLVIRAPPGDSHSATQSNLGAELKLQGERRGHGKARTEIGVILWRDPDRVVGPDLAFIAAESLPLRLSPEGYLLTIPHLMVEVVSKNDTVVEIQQKVRDYLRAGVRVVWIVDPARKTVTVHRRGRKAKTLNAAATLTVDDVIPGFAMSVADIFQE